MRKWFLLLSIVVLLVCFGSFTVSAQEPKDVLISRTVEVLDNGDSIVIELYENAVQVRTGKSGYRTYTYRNSSGSAVWNLTVDGSFIYNYGVSSTATSATATVNIYNNNARFISKNAYTSGNTATATTTVAYNTVSTTRSVSVSCDIYGNLY